MIRFSLNNLNSFIIRNTTKYIVWDFDGTLYENKKLGHDLFQEFYLVAKKKNKTLSTNSFKKISEKFGSWSAAAAHLTSTLEFKVLDIVDSKINKSKYLKKNLSLVKQIEASQDRYHHLILTNSTTSEVLSCLKKIGFNTKEKNTGPFEKIFARDNTKLLKPNSKIFEQILDFTNAAKFRHLFVGDSISHDILPAKKYGFKAIPIWELSTLFSK